MLQNRAHVWISRQHTALDTCHIPAVALCHQQRSAVQCLLLLLLLLLMVVLLLQVINISRCSTALLPCPSYTYIIPDNVFVLQ
jgi:hypothetical protein